MNPFVIAVLGGTLVQVENKKMARRKKAPADDGNKGDGSSFVEGAKIEVPDPPPVEPVAEIVDPDPGDVTDARPVETLLDATNSAILQWSTQKHGVSVCTNHTVHVPVTAKYLLERSIFISRFASIALPSNPPPGVYELADEDSTGLRTYRLPYTVYLPKK